MTEKSGEPLTGDRKLSSGSPNHPSGLDDSESGGSVGGRRMSRLAPPKRNSITGAGATGYEESAPEYDIQRQKETEAGNAIQYRTCSWQKVSKTRNIARRKDYN